MVILSKTLKILFGSYLVNNTFLFTKNMLIFVQNLEFGDVTNSNVGSTNV